MLNKVYNIFKDSIGVNTDTRTIKKDQLFIALKGDNFDGNLYAKTAIEKGAIAVIIDDDKSIDINKYNHVYKVDDSLKFLQSLANYHRKQLNIPFIALTGSNGKTTTKELIATALSSEFNVAYTKGNFNNHIGVPLTILSVDESHDIAVIEMGANHFKEIARLCEIIEPSHGYITNFGKAHLEGFGNIDGVIKAKTELYDYLFKNDGLAFINADDSVQIEKSKKIKNIKFAFNDKNVEYFFKNIIGSENATLQYFHTQINSQLTGEYNVINMAAAVSIALFFGVSIENIKISIENYEPKLNRSQITKKGNLTFIMDAYNANPTSMEAAIKNISSRKGKTIAVLGDMFELGENSIQEHQYIASLAENSEIDEIYLIGENFYKTQVKKAEKYKSREAFQAFIDNNTFQNATILIKGSRGMKLENLNF